MRKGALLRIYFRHFRTYAVMYVLIIISTVLPVSVRAIMDGMLKDSARHFLATRGTAGDFLILPSSADNSYYRGTLTMEIDWILETETKALGLQDKVTWNTLFLLDGYNSMCFAYGDLSSPGQQVSVIVDTSIPQGSYACDSTSTLPQTLFLVSGDNQSYVGLERLDEEHPYPRSFDFDLAISRTDANRILIPAQRSYCVVHFNSFDANDKVALFEALRPYENIRVLAPSLVDLTYIFRYICVPIMTSSISLYELEDGALAMLNGFALVCLCAMLFTSSYILKARKDEYSLLLMLGMDKRDLMGFRVLESLLTAAIALAASWLVVLVLHFAIPLVNAPDIVISQDPLLRFSDVYAIGGKVQFPFPFSDLIRFSILHAIALLVCDALAWASGRKT